MKGRPTDQMVYEYMFPRPKPSDPQNFHALLQRSLIPEVRQETHAFYGHLDTQEAKYPGLDYNHATHRIRLSRFTWHRRLFRAFDGLRLTGAEISGLTKWEGTKWAKEKFEKEQGITIRDTTADGFPDWSDIRDVTPRARGPAVSLERLDDDDIMADEDSEDELQSVGVELNERLRAQAARREAGESTAVLDEEWEQWLKNAIERGELTFLTEHLAEGLLQRASTSTAIPAALIPLDMLIAARAGQWTEIPEFLHGMLRRTLEAEAAVRRESESPSSPGAGEASSTASTPRVQVHYATEPWSRRTYSDLRLPVGTSAPTQPTA